MSNMGTKCFIGGNRDHGSFQTFFYERRWLVSSIVIWQLDGAAWKQIDIQLFVDCHRHTTHSWCIMYVRAEKQRLLGDDSISIIILWDWWCKGWFVHMVCWQLYDSYLIVLVGKWQTAFYITNPNMITYSANHGNYSFFYKFVSTTKSHQILADNVGWIKAVHGDIRFDAWIIYHHAISFLAILDR